MPQGLQVFDESKNILLDATTELLDLLVGWKVVVLPVSQVQ